MCSPQSLVAGTSSQLTMETRTLDSGKMRAKEGEMVTLSFTRALSR